MFAIEKMFVVYNTDDGATTIEPFKKCRCNVIDGKERIEINDRYISFSKLHACNICSI